MCRTNGPQSIESIASESWFNTNHSVCVTAYPVVDVEFLLTLASVPLLMFMWRVPTMI